MNVITFIYLEGIFFLRKTLANILILKKCRLEINFLKKHSEISETFSASFLRIAFRTLSIFLQILSMVIDRSIWFFSLKRNGNWRISEVRDWPKGFSWSLHSHTKAANARTASSPLPEWGLDGALYLIDRWRPRQQSFPSECLHSVGHPPKRGGSQSLSTCSGAEIMGPS